MSATYTASNIRVLTPAETADRFGWVKVAELAERYRRPEQWIARGLEACRRPRCLILLAVFPGNNCWEFYCPIWDSRNNPSNRRFWNLGFFRNLANTHPIGPHIQQHFVALFPG